MAILRRRGITISQDEGSFSMRVFRIVLISLLLSLTLLIVAGIIAFSFVHWTSV